MSPSDHELWQRLRGGEGEALGELFERHAQSIYGYCFRMTGDPGAADELLSTTFLEVWRLRTKMPVPDDVRAWMFGVATNLGRNRRRALRRYRAFLEQLPQLTDAAFVEDAGEMVVLRDETRKLLSSLSRLPQREREAALLVWCQGLSVEEAADALDVETGALRTRLHRARTRLRNELDSPSGKWRLAPDE
ncbi:MAG TPA: sigma-70 family RNA polymerase sigma factor [Gaiellaceae bacterium]|nr:sigma-70 family RNA polymerase sigma factor [Gaiellaceae bacterium]